MVIQHSAVEDIIHLRRVSRLWAAAGEAALFPTGFKFRPFISENPHNPVDDVERLWEVCQHPHISKGIRQLYMLSGDMNLVSFETALTAMESMKNQLVGNAMNQDWSQGSKAIIDMLVQRYQHLTSLLLEQ